MMIIYTNNIFAAPLLLAMWAIDVYLLLVSIRLIAGQIPSISESCFNRNLRQLTDPVADMIRRKLTKHRATMWLPWLILVASGLIIRQLLIAIIVM